VCNCRLTILIQNTINYVQSGVEINNPNFFGFSAKIVVTMIPPFLLLILASAVVIDAVLAFGLWFDWPQKLQRSTNGSGHMWLLLDMFGLPRIEENCTALATGYFVSGIILSTLCAVAAYVLAFPDFFQKFF
jgi:hypothetical protein